MIVTPTLHFHGQCEQALGLYQQAFDIRIDFILHYNDANQRDCDIELSEEQKGYVYHAEAYIGEQRIMLADELELHPTDSTSLFLTVTFDTASQVKKAYEVLKAGGRIIHPLRSTTYSSCMVSLIDKFGFRWGLMTEQTGI
ncbi:VOC family protein [Paenibacillus graminis]|uniref:VOC family protein n=1 Tax=Paenibacillus graminis TaxID=189425 RepID=UPI002DB939C0|nr:VOC family protein [Paenibacillus graminis]MEC0169168.1 VOC family protein [Paenibacillus graminis]